MHKLALIAAAAVATPALAQMSFTDDLTDGVFDAPFAYDLSSDSTLNGPGNDFNSLDNFGLLLATDDVDITFPGVTQPVSFASVTFSDFTGTNGTFVTFFGTLSSISFFNSTTGSPETVSATSAQIGDITLIQVSAFETVVTEVSIRTIPAPGALAMLGVAGIAATRRRR